MTTALIGLENPDGTITAIFLRNGGSPKEAGRILKVYYGDVERVRLLMELGDLEVLGMDLGVKHDGNNPPDNTCNAFRRDYGMVWQHAVKYPCFDSFTVTNLGQTYLYRANEWMLVERRPTAVPFAVEP